MCLGGEAELPSPLSMGRTSTLSILTQVKPVDEEINVSNGGGGRFTEPPPFAHPCWNYIFRTFAMVI